MRARIQPSHVLWCAVLIASCGRLDFCNQKPLPPKTCAAPVGGMSATADEFEPNDDLTMATAPAAHTADCGLTMRSATISGGNDVDVFRTGACDVTEDQQPTAELRSGDSLIRMCIFLACDTGTTTNSACGGVSGDDPADNRVLAARTDGGFRGCCRTGVGTLTAKVQCSGFPLRNHSVEGYIWVDANENAVTSDLPYELQYQMR